MPASQRGTPDFGDPSGKGNVSGETNGPGNVSDDKPQEGSNRAQHGRDSGERDSGEHTFAEESMSNADLASRIRDLENTLAATRAGMPLTLIPEHGAGPGTEVAETWSQYDQEQTGHTELPNH